MSAERMSPEGNIRHIRPISYMVCSLGWIKGILSESIQNGALDYTPKCQTPRLRKCASTHPGTHPETRVRAEPHFPPPQHPGLLPDLPASQLLRLHRPSAGLTTEPLKWSPFSASVPFENVLHAATRTSSTCKPGQSLRSPEPHRCGCPLCRE